MAKGIDWDFIKSEYEETTKSIRLIAEQNNITHGAIQAQIRKAKKNGNEWVRKDHEEIVKDKALINSRKPLLKKIALRKIEEIKLELGERYSVLDEPLIVAFAKSYELWISARLIIEDEGSISKSSKGSPYISPYENLAQMHLGNFTKIAGQLGLSIASRKRLKLDPKSDTEEDSLFDILDELNEDDVDV